MAFDITTAANRLQLALDSPTSDLTDVVVPVRLGKRVGKNGFNTTDVFTKLEGNSKKLAFEIGDTGTQCYGEIESWPEGVAAFKGTPNVTHAFGSNNSGTAGLSVYGSPVDNADYYTFDGVGDGLYRGSDLGNSSNEVIWAEIRIHDKLKGTIQTIWKDGGGTHGIQAAIDASGNLGIFGRSNSALTSIVVPPAEYENNVWYQVFFTKERVSIVDKASGDVVAVAFGSVSAGDGSNHESVGYDTDGSPLDTASGSDEFFDGDIAVIEIYPESELVAPVPAQLLTAGTKGVPTAVRDLGSNQEGADGLTVVGAPVDNGDFYTFDGVGDGLHANNDLGHSGQEVCVARFRVHDKNKGTVQCIWKDGGGGNGVGVGIDAAGNLGIFGNSNSTVTSLTIPPADYQDNVWYTGWFLRNVVALYDDEGLPVAQATGSFNSGDGTAEESIGFVSYQSPFTAEDVSNTYYFDGDIDFVEIYPSADELTLPQPLQALINVRIPSALAASQPVLNLHYDPAQDDNDTYIGYPASTAAKQVYATNCILALTFAQDPGGGAGAVLDSSSYGNHGTASNLSTADMGKDLAGRNFFRFGGNSYITLTDNGQLAVAGNQLAVEAVFRPSGFGSGSGVPCLVSRWGANNSYFLAIDDGDTQDAGDTRFMLNIGSSVEAVGATAAVVDVLKHFGASYDGAALEVFDDGTLDGSQAGSGNIAAGSSEVLVGALNNSQTANGILGDLYSLRLWKEPKTAEYFSYQEAAFADNLVTWAPGTSISFVAGGGGVTGGETEQFWFVGFESLAYTAQGGAVAGGHAIEFNPFADGYFVGWGWVDLEEKTVNIDQWDNPNFNWRDGLFEETENMGRGSGPMTNNTPVEVVSWTATGYADTFGMKYWRDCLSLFMRMN